MSTRPAFDLDLLRRYDRPGPRYTSYPCAPQFSACFTDADFRRQAARSNQEPIPRDLSLYVHVPFCFSPCFYCGCNRIITRDVRRGAPYAERLVREAEMVAPLFDRDRDVVQLHFGGGTPNFLDTAALGGLIESLGRFFHFSAYEFVLTHRPCREIRPAVRRIMGRPRVAALISWNVCRRIQACR
jgi:oxygen-independent coproporphyrinogen-3 oxidase